MPVLVFRRVAAFKTETKSTLDGLQVSRALFIKLFKRICKPFRFAKSCLQPRVGRGPKAFVNGNTVVLSDLKHVFL